MKKWITIENTLSRSQYLGLIFILSLVGITKIILPHLSSEQQSAVALTVQDYK